MNRIKAIIFDMDGVLINSETTWRKAEDRFLKDLCGEEKYWEIRPNLIGATPEQIYDSVLGIGITLSRELFSNAYNKEVKNVYNDSKLTPGIKLLLNFLEKKNLLIGLVSSSPKSWIDLVLTRFGKTKRVFKTIITLSEQMALRPKPYPDGYQEAMKKLKVKPITTIIVEDSPTGVSSAKASGAYTICFTEFLETDIPKNADLYAKNVSELQKIIEERI